MTDRRDAANRLRAWVFAGLLALAGCGPGTGGTGTGPIAMAKFMGTSGSPAFSTAAGLCAVSACGDVYLRLEPATVDLRLVCRSFLANGDWRADADGVAVVLGTITTLSGGVASTQPGSLRLQLKGDPASPREVTLTLFDAGGKAVAGPLVVNREDAALAPVPGRCS